MRKVTHSPIPGYIQLGIIYILITYFLFACVLTLIDNVKNKTVPIEEVYSEETIEEPTFIGCRIVVQRSNKKNAELE